ncbi:peptide synthase [Planctopirus ephydatiae]|uniref:Peptide synthase n=2 Tax=Planctopirus ephydatiae TaxID=2528019 RepID=A0A518GTI7_9PLAN|nr:peptide synthase [Planctopirus ephydatiae]
MEPMPTLSNSESSVAEFSPSARWSFGRQVCPQRFPANFADMCQFLVGHANTQQVHVIVRYDGRIDATHLQRALRMVVVAEPILGCRFVEHWYRPYWQRRDDHESMDLCTVVESVYPERELAEFLEAEMDPRVDPMIHVRVIRGDRDTLCYKMNHVAGDAPSLMKIIAMVSKNYLQGRTGPDVAPTVNLRSRDHSEVIRHFPISHRLRVIGSFLANQRKTRNLWLLKADQVGERRDGGHYYIRRLEPDVGVAAAKLAKRKRTTMTVVMLAVLYRTLRRHIGVTGEEGLGVGTTVDHRNYLPAKERELSPVANLSGPSRMFVPLPADASLEQVVEVINEQFKRSHKQRLLGLNYPGVILAMPVIRWLLLPVPFGWVHRLLKWGTRSQLRGLVRACGLANAGEMAPLFPEFDGVKVVDALATVSIYRAAGMGFFMSQFNGAVTISLGATESLAKPEVCELILDGISQELCSLEESSRPMPSASTEVPGQ